jgi:DNA-binding CsgD family transcriptional regulator
VQLRHLGARGLLLRPFALALHPLEPAFAILCALVLGIVFLADAVTPSTVVASLALIPLLAAGWLFSGRAASGVALVAAVLFGLGFMVEAENRSTFIIVGVVTVAVVAVTRLYATKLVALLSQLDYPVSHKDRFAVGGVEAQPPLIGSLTRRELEVAQLAAEGLRAAEISAELQIGERTVESHLASIYSKLGINSKAKLVWMAAAQPADSPLARRN